MIEQHIIIAVGLLIVSMCGVIWGKVCKLGDKFDEFNENCRERHEGVVNKDDWIREHSKLERSLSVAHARLDAGGMPHGYETDRR